MPSRSFLSLECGGLQLTKIAFLPSCHGTWAFLSPRNKLQIKAWWYFVAIIVERNERRKQNRLKFVAVIYHHASTTGTNTRKNLDGTSPPPTWTDVNIPLVYWNGLCSLQQLPLSIEEWYCCHDGESTMWIQPQPHSSFSSALVSQRTERTTTDGRRHFHFHQGTFS